MEIKTKLQKPYTEEERLNFIVENNHKLGYMIEEVEEGLQALGYTEDELQTQEREQINMLSLTAADVERAIYKAKGMDFEDVIKEVEKLNSEKVEELVNESNMSEANNMNSSTIQPFNSSTAIDLKALKIELKANNFYRGNPYVEQIGAVLGFTSDDLDYLFENGELPNDGMV